MCLKLADGHLTTGGFCWEVENEDPAFRCPGSTSWPQGLSITFLNSVSLSDLGDDDNVHPATLLGRSNEVSATGTEEVLNHCWQL